jgi:hypothetical protein
MWLRAFLVVAGLGGIVGSAVWFTDATVFPGIAAVVPTAATVLVIAAGGGGVTGQPRGVDNIFAKLWAVRPIRYLGDMSYSVYLWHWPVVAMLPYALGHEIRPFDAAVAVVGILALSVASYELVEKPPQRSVRLRARLSRSFVAAGLGMALITAIGGGAYVAVPGIVQERLTQAREAVAEIECAGALAVLDPKCIRTDGGGGGMYPDPGLAPMDIALFDQPNCLRNAGSGTLAVCQFGSGSRTESRGVTLWGNSHAQQWLPALVLTAKDLAFSVTTRITSGCFPKAPGPPYEELERADDCVDLTEAELAAILEDMPDLVVMSNMTNLPSIASPVLVDSAEWVLSRLTEHGIPVLIIRDNPREPSGRNTANCLSINRSEPTLCDGSRDSWVTSDPWVEAAARLGSGQVQVLDLTDAICDLATCHSVVGSVVVYADSSHLTETFVRTTAPYVRQAVADALNGP